MAGAYARSIGDTDPATALAWAQSVRDENERTASVVSVARQWFKTEGDGAFLKMQQAGLSDDIIAQARSPKTEWAVKLADEKLAYSFVHGLARSSKLDNDAGLEFLLKRTPSAGEVLNHASGRIAELRPRTGPLRRSISTFRNLNFLP